MTGGGGRTYYRRKRLLKTIGILLIALLISGAFYAGQINGFRESYAAEDYGTEISVGTTVGAYVEGFYTGTTEEQKWQISLPKKGLYKVELWGPASQSGERGGYISATGLFSESDDIYITLGPGALIGANGANGSSSKSPVPSQGGYPGSGYLSGAYGGSGNVWYSSGTYPGGGGGAGASRTTTSSDISKSDIRLNSSSWANVILVAGGSGAKGGSCTTLGGAGGPGGEYTVIANGDVSEIGSKSLMNGTDGVSYVQSGGVSNGRTGGAGGGGGGSNYVDCYYFSSYSSLGSNNTGVSKFKISYVGNYKPSGTDESIVYMADKLAEAIANSGNGQSEAEPPNITVVAGLAFNIAVTKYDDMIAGSQDGITVTNDISGDGCVIISGTINDPGIHTYIINGKKFVITAIQEPNSSNVLVTFN